MRKRIKIQAHSTRELHEPSNLKFGIGLIIYLNNSSSSSTQLLWNEFKYFKKRVSITHQLFNLFTFKNITGNLLNQFYIKYKQ